uniref:Uncharacterized protein n=1 Tax=Meloidogyne incognita TaxID=6306 RepID=A0A914NTF6_MELIC
MRTPKQLEEWPFSTENSDNIKNKIGDETLVEVLKHKEQIQKLETKHRNEIEEIKQNLKQKDEKIILLEAAIKNLHNQSNDLIKLQTNF